MLGSRVSGLEWFESLHPEPTRFISTLPVGFPLFFVYFLSSSKSKVTRKGTTTESVRK